MKNNKLMLYCALVVYCLFYLSVYAFPYDYFLADGDIVYGDIVGLYLLAQFVLFYVIDKLDEDIKKAGDSS